KRLTAAPAYRLPVLAERATGGFGQRIGDAGAQPADHQMQRQLWVSCLQRIDHRGEAPAPGTHGTHYVDQALGHALLSGLTGVGAGQLRCQAYGMRLIAPLGQLDLPLTLLRPAPGLLRQAVIAMRATDALLVLRGSHVLGRERTRTRLS